MPTARARSSAASPVFPSTTMRTSASVLPRATRSRRSNSTFRVRTSRAKAKPSAAIPISPRKSCAAARATTDKTLIVKLSPNVTDIAAVAREAEAAGADALAVINTVRGMAIDVEAWRPRLGNVTGGLSGPAIRPIAVLAVYEVAQAVTIPIVGQGGIENAHRCARVLLGRSDARSPSGRPTSPIRASPSASSRELARVSRRGEAASQSKRSSAKPTSVSQRRTNMKETKVNDV